MEPSVSVHTILGDTSGVLHIQAGQSFYIEYTVADNRRSIPPVNFDLDVNGTLYLPADFCSKGNKEEPFVWEGLVIGVYNYTLPEGKVLNLGIDASNTQLNDGQYIAAPMKGKFICLFSSDMEEITLCWYFYINPALRQFILPNFHTLHCYKNHKCSSPSL